MAYFPLHKLRLPADNVRRATRVALLIPVGIVTELVAVLFHIYNLLPVGIAIAGIGALFALLFAVPMILVAVVFFLAPIVAYFFADDRAYPILRGWWYWITCALCVWAGVWALVDAHRRYPRKNNAPNHLPEPNLASVTPRADPRVAPSARSVH